MSYTNEPDTKVGDRVRLLTMDDEFTDLRPGAEGVVRFIDSMGTYHVAWDDGHNLGLCYVAGDRWEVLP